MRLTGAELVEIRDGCEGAQGGPWKLDKFACYIWAPSEKGGDFPVMDDPGQNGRVAGLRGWGYYTGNGAGGLGLSADEATRRQRLTGEHVARLSPERVSALVTELLELRAALTQIESKANDVFVAHDPGEDIPMGHEAAWKVADLAKAAAHALDEIATAARKALETP